MFYRVFTSEVNLATLHATVDAAAVTAGVTDVFVQYTWKIRSIGMQ